MVLTFASRPWDVCARSDTPRIVGAGIRTVFNSFAGFSADGDAVEVYA